MVLFVGITVLSLVLAYFCNNQEAVQLNMQKDYHLYRSNGSLMDRQRALNLCLLSAIYLVLAGVSACRIASGNDYWGYVNNFSLIAQNRDVASEVGFNFLVRLMQSIFGVGAYLPIFGLFSLLTVYFSLRSIYEQGDIFVASLFFFMMNGYYFSGFNSVRFYFVLAIAMYSIKFVFRGQYGRFILWVLLASLFHKSVLVIIPVYLVAIYLANIKLKWYHYVIGGLLLVSLIFGQDLYRMVIFKFYPFYENSAFDHVDYSLTNIAKCVGTLTLCGIAYKGEWSKSVRNRFYFYLNLVGTALYIFGAFIPEVSRIAYYFVIAQTFLLPNVLSGMKKGWLKNLCIIGTASFFLLHFGLFLYTAYEVDIRLLPYLNWIFN